MTTVLVNMTAASSQILNLNTLAPQTNGYQGTLTIRATSLIQGVGFVVATALRINPSNSFTPVRAFLPKL